MELSIFIIFNSKQQIIAKTNVPGINKNYDSFIDDKDTIWIAGNEAIYLSPFSNPLNLAKLPFPLNDPIQKVKQFRQIKQFKNGEYLIATSQGLFIYKKEVGTLQSYTENQETKYQLSGGVVNQFVLDAQENVWIATDNGLNFLSHKTGEITKSFSSVDGLCDNLVYSLLLENDSTLWLGTDGGLSRFNISKERFKTDKYTLVELMD